MMKFIFSIVASLFLCIPQLCAEELKDQFFPVDERWMFKMLDLKRELWAAEPFQIEFRVRPEEKVWVKVVVHQNYFDFEPEWRNEVERYIRWLTPKIDKIVRKYASVEFLSVYQTELDIEYFVYLDTSLYGVKKQGVLQWKRGIY